MSLLEGHGNSVMNKLGEEYVAGQARAWPACCRHAGRAAASARSCRSWWGSSRRCDSTRWVRRSSPRWSASPGPGASTPRGAGPEFLPTVEELARPRDWLTHVDRALSATGSGAVRLERTTFACGGPPPVIVGCSGGADSTALLALAVDAELTPIAVHVDHGLRDGSAAEAEVVAAVAARLGAEFRSVRVTIARGPTSRPAHATRATTRSSRHVSPAVHRPCSWGTRPTTRRRPYCSTCCAARPPPASRACLRRAIGSRGRCSGGAAPSSRRAVRATRAARARRSDEPRRHVPAGGDPPRGHAAARTHRRARSHAGVGSPGRAAARGD